MEKQQEMQQNTQQSGEQNVQQSREQDVQQNRQQDEDIDALIAILDGFVEAEGSRLKIQVTEGEGKVLEKQYHHGRCDVGSPWAKGTAFDLCE